jgi:hypothetical protein
MSLVDCRIWHSCFYTRIYKLKTNLCGPVLHHGQTAPSDMQIPLQSAGSSKINDQHAWIWSKLRGGAMPYYSVMLPNNGERSLTNKSRDLMLCGALCPVIITIKKIKKRTAWVRNLFLGSQRAHATKLKIKLFLFHLCVCKCNNFPHTHTRNNS